MYYVNSQILKIKTKGYVHGIDLLCQEQELGCRLGIELSSKSI